jgi:hypothetical protein
VLLPSMVWPCCGVVTAPGERGLDIGDVQWYSRVRMTTHQTAEATTDAQPGEGEVLLYIDWQGKKLYGKKHAAKAEKEGTKTK